MSETIQLTEEEKQMILKKRETELTEEQKRQKEYEEAIRRHENQFRKDTAKLNADAESIYNALREAGAVDKEVILLEEKRQLKGAIWKGDERVDYKGNLTLSQKTVQCKQLVLTNSKEEPIKTNYTTISSEKSRSGWKLYAWCFHRYQFVKPETFLRKLREYNDGKMQEYKEKLELGKVKDSLIEKYKKLYPKAEIRYEKDWVSRAHTSYYSKGYEVPTIIIKFPSGSYVVVSFGTQGENTGYYKMYNAQKPRPKTKEELLEEFNAQIPEKKS